MKKLLIPDPDAVLRTRLYEIWFDSDKHSFIVYEVKVSRTRSHEVEPYDCEAWLKTIEALEKWHMWQIEQIKDLKQFLHTVRTERL